MITCILNITDYERQKLAGQWSVFVRPTKWNKRKREYIGEGRMVLTQIGRKRCGGYLYLEWKNELGFVVVKGLYELELSFCQFRKITGRSIMKIREESNDGLFDADKARVNFCNYDLKIYDKNKKIKGKLIMDVTRTESLFLATKENGN